MAYYSWMGRTVIDLPLMEVADFIAKPDSAVIFDKYIVVSYNTLHHNNLHYYYYYYTAYNHFENSTCSNHNSGA